MKITLKQIFLLLTLAAISAAVYRHYLLEPERRIRRSGATYEPHKKNGEMVLAFDFDDDRLRQVVLAINDVPEPCTLYLTGAKVSDNGMVVFKLSTNLTEVWLVDLKVTANALRELVQAGGLQRINVANCPNINLADVELLRTQNPAITFVWDS